MKRWIRKKGARRLQVNGKKTTRVKNEKEKGGKMKRKRRYLPFFLCSFSVWKERYPPPETLRKLPAAAKNRDPQPKANLITRYGG